MKRLLSIGFFLVCIQVLLTAQNFRNEYGKIGKDDLEFSSYPKDKTAEAVVIYDIGSSYFQENDNSFELIYNRSTRIKVLKEAGIKWAKIEIPYYQKDNIYEQIEELEACTYNLKDGLLIRTPLNISNSHDEKLNEFWKVRKFAMPNVKEGSVIEYRYKIRSQYLFNLRSWEFQSKIPVIFSQYTVKMIPFYEYTYLLQGTTKFDFQQSTEDTYERQFGPIKFHDMIHEYAMKDIPAFNDEEYISSIDDYIMKINFQLSKVTQTDGYSRNIMTTWPEMIKDLLKEDDFSRYADKSEKLAAKIFDIKTFSLLPESVKFDSVMNYVKTNYSWNKINSKYASKSPNAFVKDKTGNSADINLFAVGLLRACGIKAIPVILSTRKNGKILLDYPFSSFFNYVALSVNIDGNNVITDATDPLSPNNRIPEKCINDKGLLIQKDKVDWILLQCNFPSKIQSIIRITLSDSIQDSKISTSATEYDALTMRKDYGKKVVEIQKKLMDDGYTVSDSTITVENADNVLKPYLIKFKATSKTETINSKIYVSPFAKEALKDNPLKQNERTYPIDMIYPVKRLYFSEIEIPKGYKVDYIPVNEKISNNQFELEYSITCDYQKINVLLIYSFKFSIYPPEDYSKIKYYFSDIVKKGAEKIVLVKI